MKTFCGLIIGIAVVTSGIAAIFGTGLFIIGHQVQKPETAELVRQRLKNASLLDIVGGKPHPRTISSTQSKDVIIIPGMRRGDHLHIEVELNEFHSVWLMVDTGATNLLMETEVADRLNISKAESIEAISPTANGTTQNFVNMLDTVRIEDAVQHNVRASFGEGLKITSKMGCWV